MKNEKLPSGVSLGRPGTHLIPPSPAIPIASGVGRLPSLRMEAGIIRLFGKGDIASRGLVGGWAAPEEGHIWNDGLEAVQTIELAQQPAAALTIVVEGVPYVYGNASRQDITLFANGYRLGAWRFSERRLATLTALVEPEHWFIRNGAASLRLTWHLPGSARPSDIGDGPDGRIIGFAFRTICLQEA